MAPSTGTGTIDDPFCQWWYLPWGEPASVQCGRPAGFTDPRPNLGMWLCAMHYDVACACLHKDEYAS